MLPELLCPAGDKERFFTVLRYGADAIYLGGEDFNLRAKTKGVSLEDLSSLVQIAHANQKKVYFCLNILAQEKHLDQIRLLLEKLETIPIDALIIADPGVIKLAQKYLPYVPIHLSTQANTSNSLSVLFWQELGIKRVNLARELNFKQIKQIVQNIGSSIELELFVHGAMCMAISGRCFLSAYLNQRSANLGLCTHPCRFEYSLKEKNRDQAIFEVIEQGYSKILASEDLCLLKYLNWMRKNKINSLKIEGRNKSVAYVARVTDVYKTALLDLEQRKFNYDQYIQALEPTFTRKVGTGFFLGSPKLFYLPQKQVSKTLAWIAQKITDEKWLLRVKQTWSIDQEVKIKLPRLQEIVLSPGDYFLEAENGQKIDIAHPGLNYYFYFAHPKLQPHLVISD